MGEADDRARVSRAVVNRAMHFLRARWVFAVVIGMSALSDGSRAAQPGIAGQKIGPLQKAPISADEQARIFQTLGEADPGFRALVEMFPKGENAVLKAREAGRYTVSSSFRVGEYLASFRISGEFSEDFSKVSDVRRDSFSAHRLADLRVLKDGQVAKPIRLSPDELDAFFKNPVALIDARARSPAVP